MIGLIIFCSLATVIVILVFLTSSYFMDKKRKIARLEPRSSIWGQNYPKEYDTWRQSANLNYKSRSLSGSRRDLLADRPAMVILWAGYAFSRDYKAPRSHNYAVFDIRESLRVGSPGVEGQRDLQPATCWVCKSPDAARMIDELGPASFYKASFSSMGPEIVNAIGCADCHNPNDLTLTITRPALREALSRRGIDVNKATPKATRTLVCAQCHVEYYFQGEGKYLTFPWDKGLTVEDMENYYDERQITDWTHAISGAPMLKAQHPDYELFLMGPFGQNDLSCADCHMPLITENGVKYSDHQLESPLKNLSTTCQNCHKKEEASLLKRVQSWEERIRELRGRLEPELVKAHLLTRAAAEKGASPPKLTAVRKLIREAQWRWDFAVASHGASFHAPMETLRILSSGLERANMALKALNDIFQELNLAPPDLPDLAAKAQAQSYIGLNMPVLAVQKRKFLAEAVPEWLAAARANGRI
jgi:nitrite reductase (cytochrome c-552)